MNPTELLSELLGSKGSFESAVAESGPPNGPAIAVPLLIGLDSHPDLENGERERRITVFLSKVPLDNAHLAAIAEAGATLSNPVLKNALTQLLPAEFRGILFKRLRNQQPSESSLSRVEAKISDSGRDRVGSQSNSDEHSDFSDVVILSINDDPATRKLLLGSGFTPLRCPTAEEINKMLAQNENICAFLVETSFLRSLDHDQQLSLITSLARFSTFAWLRFQEDGLPLNAIEAGQFIARERFRPAGLSHADLTFRDRAGLQEGELPVLVNARERLNSIGTQSLFTPGELNGLELRLLAAAMSNYAKERKFLSPQAELTQVITKFIPGGGSGARVAVVRVNDFRDPVVVKLDKKELILDEAHRFFRFIYKDNTELRPETHFHANAALIVFGIIPSDHAEEEQPAPTLEFLLTQLWYDEMRNPQQISCDEQLIRGFKDATRRLAILNKQNCTSPEFECKANPYLESLKQMEQNGLDWGFCNADLEKRREAESVVATASHSAVCHGDAHTRNVLIRGEEGFLIDYANSGPGHPCSDLVRIESAIFFTRFTQFTGEAEFIELQRQISIERLDLNRIVERFPVLLKSQNNRRSLKLCLIARDCAAEVLSARGLGWEHYLAVKLLTAWQSLQVPTLQQSLVRSVIESLS